MRTPTAYPEAQVGKGIHDVESIWNMRNNQILAKEIRTEIPAKGTNIKCRVSRI